MPGMKTVFLRLGWVAMIRDIEGVLYKFWLIDVYIIHMLMFSFVNMCMCYVCILNYMTPFQYVTSTACVWLYDVHSFIYYWDLYSATSRLLLRSAPNPYMTKTNSFQARVECVWMCQPLGAIAVPTEAHSTQMGSTNENARVCLVEVWAKRTKRVTWEDNSHIPLSGGSCDLWCPGWDSKDLTGRLKQGPADTFRPGQQSGIWSTAGSVACGVHVEYHWPFIEAELICHTF